MKPARVGDTRKVSSLPFRKWPVPACLGHNFEAPTPPTPRWAEAPHCFSEEADAAPYQQEKMLLLHLKTGCALPSGAEDLVATAIPYPGIGTKHATQQTAEDVLFRTENMTLPFGYEGRISCSRSMENRLCTENCMRHYAAHRH